MNGKLTVPRGSSQALAVHCRITPQWDFSHWGTEAGFRP